MVLCFRARGIQLRRVICQKVVTRSRIMRDHVVEFVARPFTEVSEMILQQIVHVAANNGHMIRPL